MADNLNVQVVVGLVDRLSRSLRGLQRQMRATLDATANMTFVGRALADTGQGVVRPLTDAAQTAMAFESAMADVRKVVDFATQDGPAELAATLERLSRTIPLTAEGLAEIAAAGGQLGLGADALPGYVETVAKAATAFDMLPDAAGTAFAKLADVYAIPIQQIGGLGDAVNHLSHNTAARQ
jgi:TP901 family phage tail tape measure protein